MNFLNYHHLRYFHAIAREGTLTAAAARLGVSQSSVSVQLKQLEENLGQPLFHRQRKSLVLTEAGRIALDHAEAIFRTGQQLVATLQGLPADRRRVLRVGAVATLSRNFQLECLKPFIGRADVELVLRSGSLGDLLRSLQAHTLDLVLSNHAVKRDADNDWHNHLLATEPVALVGRKTKGQRKFRFPEDLAKQPVLLPTIDNAVRASFDLLMERAGIRPRIAAGGDGLALLRLGARAGAGLGRVPPGVVAGELQRAQLVVRHRFEDIRERFYAILPPRRYPNPLVEEILQAIQTQTRWAKRPA